MTEDLFPKDEPKRYPAAEASATALDLYRALSRHCERIEIAGSLRRHKPYVHDIDLVVIPGPGFQLFFQEHRITPKGGDKIIRFRWEGIPVDLYVATAETWATLLLIRTGSKEHNIILCKRAREMNLCLKANGDGLEEPADCHDVRRVKVMTEADIFDALKMPYKEPWEREA